DELAAIVGPIVARAEAALATFCAPVASDMAMPVLSRRAAARLIDHTLLKPEARREDVVALCSQAVEHEFASVCVNPVWVETCRHRLEGSAVAVCCVVGFPLGATLTAVKVFETQAVMDAGAQEVDMVLNIGLLR